MDKIKYIVNVLIVFLMIGAVSINKNGRILGESIIETQSKNTETTSESENPTQTVDNDGTIIINTTTIGKDIIGYAGRTPINLYVKDERIVKVEALKNSETPSFFKLVENSGLLNYWDGKSLSEALEQRPDAVSGATFSSMAVAENVNRAVSYINQIDSSKGSISSLFTLKNIIGILVILSGVFITLTRPKNKIFETIQLALNVIVLGFWCGSFLSLSQFVSWMSNGLNISISILAVLLLAVVLILPLFGTKGSYCHMHCPLGSAQALMGRVPFTKIKLGRKVSTFLNNLRYYILAALLLIMWVGNGFELMDYELFPAFIVESASTVVLVAAGVFLILSMFITKPYCRFVCPTGALLTVMQKTKE